MEYTNTFSRYWNTDHWVPLMRNAQYQLFRSQQLKFTSAGNLKRKPGEIILIHLPIITALTDVEVDLTRGEIMQGKYMITSIKHQITSNNTHTMDVEVSRDGFEDEYSSINPDSIGNVGMINTSNEWIGGGYEGEVVGESAADVVGGVADDVVEYFVGDGADISRTLDTPGYLHPEDYSFFGPAGGTDTSDDGGGFWNEPTGDTPLISSIIDDVVDVILGEDDNEEGAEFTNIIDGKTIAQLYKESIKDPSSDDPTGLEFVSGALSEGITQNFSRYDWSEYGNLAGHMGSGEESGEDEDEGGFFSPIINPTG